MNLIKKLCVVFTGLMLAACASSQPTSLPFMPASHYTNLAILHNSSAACMNKGFFTPERMNQAVYILRYVTNSFIYDNSKLNQEMLAHPISVYMQTMNQQRCNEVATVILRNLDEINAQLNTKREQAQAHNEEIRRMTDQLNQTRPRITNCIRTGPQTLCNTF